MSIPWGELGHCPECAAPEGEHTEQCPHNSVFGPVGRQAILNRVQYDGEGLPQDIVEFIEGVVEGKLYRITQTCQCQILVPCGGCHHNRDLHDDSGACSFFPQCDCTLFSSYECHRCRGGLLISDAIVEAASRELGVDDHALIREALYAVEALIQSRLRLM